MSVHYPNGPDFSAGQPSDWNATGRQDVGEPDLVKFARHGAKIKRKLFDLESSIRAYDVSYAGVYLPGEAYARFGQYLLNIYRKHRAEKLSNEYLEVQTLAEDYVNMFNQAEEIVDKYHTHPRTQLPADLYPLESED